MATSCSETRPFAQVRPAAPRAAQAPPSLYQCLVLSAQDERALRFQESAGESGWETVVCQDAQQASLQIARHRFPLVLVDLEGADAATAAGFQQVTEQLARQGGQLLVVCGGEDDPRQEIWARQLGAWVYLPGVEERCDLTIVCDEARLTANKLFPHLTMLPTSGNYAYSV